jgi:hypothetical protein
LIGRTKEFIVTESILKNGDKKRTFKAVDSEKDWIAIKTMTEQEIERSHKTVEHIFTKHFFKIQNRRSTENLFVLSKEGFIKKNSNRF